MILRADPDNPFLLVGENGHVYPSAHGPGSHWATDEAWAILDRLKPQAISDETRFLLGGMIAGTLMRMAQGRLSSAHEAPVFSP